MSVTLLVVCIPHFSNAMFISPLFVEIRKAANASYCSLCAGIVQSTM